MELTIREIEPIFGHWPWPRAGGLLRDRLPALAPRRRVVAVDITLAERTAWRSTTSTATTGAAARATARWPIRRRSPATWSCSPTRSTSDVIGAPGAAPGRARPRVSPWRPRRAAAAGAAAVPGTHRRTPRRSATTSSSATRTVRRGGCRRSSSATAGPCRRSAWRRRCSPGFQARTSGQGHELRVGDRRMPLLRSTVVDHDSRAPRSVDDADQLSRAGAAGQGPTRPYPSYEFRHLFCRSSRC